MEMQFRKLSVLLITFGISTIVCLYLMGVVELRVSQAQEYHVEVINNFKQNQVFVVDTPACRIPDLNPFDLSIKHLINPRKKFVCTSGNASITYEDGKMLRINSTALRVRYNDSLGYCQYRAMHRANGTDFKVIFSDPVTFIKDLEINQTFIKVICVDNQNHTIYTNFHSFILPENDTEIRCEKSYKQHISKHKPKEVMNIVMLGIDAQSRLNVIRQMPLTRKYLLEDLAAIEMLGYTKVADNTFVNVVPLLTGKFSNEHNWKYNTVVDPMNFIWKDLSSRGYRTFYAEDAPSIAIFHYLKKGFRQQPTDFYNRAMSYKMEQHGKLWHNNHVCFGDRHETDIILKQQKEFQNLYRHKPHFVFTFLTRLTHTYINDAGSIDDHLFQYLKSVHKEGLLNNTVFFFFSDHGCRYGRIRQVFVGKIEERMPMLYIIFPKWFHQKYPEIVKTVKVNTRRLSSPFDMYETLKDLLDFNGKVKVANISKRGISLFRELPRNRSCDQAGILPHWCVCMASNKLNTSLKLVQNSGKYVVDRLNKLLNNDSDVCETLTVKEIRDPVQLGANDFVVRNLKHSKKINSTEKIKTVVMIQFTIVTKPGNAMFESTVKFDEKSEKYYLAGSISRINKYGDQSHCVNVHSLKKYCYCKKQLKKA